MIKKQHIYICIYMCVYIYMHILGRFLEKVCTELLTVVVSGKDNRGPGVQRRLLSFFLVLSEYLIECIGYFFN